MTFSEAPKHTARNGGRCTARAGHGVIALLSSRYRPAHWNGDETLRKKSTKKPTLIDVGRDAGVSTATASLVVRKSGLVSDKTRAKVLTSIRKLGYVHDRVAASLRSRVSSTVGVIITDIGNPFLSEVLVGLHNSLNSMGYDVLLGTTFDSIAKQDALLETMIGNKICGLVLCPVGTTSRDNLLALEKSNVPTVLVGRDVSYPNRYDLVVADSFSGAKLAVQHLADAGHRRIAFLGGTEQATYRRRLAGYLAALAAIGIAQDMAIVLQGPSTFEFGDSAIRAVLGQTQPPTAAFCYNDVVAIGAIQGLHHIGLRAGCDVGLVGFDNIKQATITNPALTSISVDVTRWGDIIARLLAKRVREPDAPQEKVVVEPALVVRDSSTRYRTCEPRALSAV
jgi:LacI family transcriptional regulator